MNIAVATIVLLLVHTAAGLRGADIGTNVVVACVNAYALWNAYRFRHVFGRLRLLLYAAGYAGFFAFFALVAKAPVLFAGFGLLYAACFRLPFLLGYLLIIVFSVAVLTPYWIPSSLLLGLLYTIIAPLAPRRDVRFHVVCFTIGFLLIVGIVLPLLYLCFQITPQTLLVNLTDPRFRDALATSLITASISTLIILVIGVPFAYALVRLDFWGKRFVDSLIDLPIVIPQSVAGIALLVLLGPKTPVGEFMKAKLGLEVAGSYLGIIVCQVFVSCPFLVRSAMTAFHDMGPSLENVSRTLGASSISTFVRVSLPLASGAIFSGCILTWARAVSEVGSLMVLSYHPFTVSVYTYDLFVQYGLTEARPAAVLLVIVCLWGFLVLRWLRTVSLGPVFAFGGKRSS